MKVSTFVLIATCALTLPANSQAGRPGTTYESANSRHGEIHITKIKIPLTGTMVGKAKCDDEGNIYIRLMSAEMAKQHHGIYKIPIEKVRPNGTVATTFRITDLSPDASGKDFFVTGDGRVFQSAFMPDASTYVAEFTASGSLKSRIALDAAGVAPYQIAVFDTGELLVSGTIAAQDYRPFTGVFDVHGKLLKEIYEPEDEASRRGVKGGDPDVLPEYAVVGNTFAWRGDAAIGSDGNAYLLRAASPALIYVISSKGQLIRKFRVDAGSPDLVARSLKPAPGRFAVSFLYKGQLTGMIRIVDLEGNQIASHSFNDEESQRIPGLPGCYSSDAFTILEDDAEHNVYLERATHK